MVRGGPLVPPSLVIGHSFRSADYQSCKILFCFGLRSRIRDHDTWAPSTLNTMPMTQCPFYLCFCYADVKKSHHLFLFLAHHFVRHISALHTEFLPPSLHVTSFCLATLVSLQGCTRTSAKLLFWCDLVNLQILQLAAWQDCSSIHFSTPFTLRCLPENS